MPKHRQLLIVVADGEHARFIRPQADHALHTQAQFDSASAHKQSSDLGSDKPGASFHTRATAHHGIAPRHDLHTLEKQHFAHLVAAQLNQAAATYDALVIAAPAHTLTAIQDALDDTVRAKLAGTLPKDLVKTPDDALQPHLSAWVRPVHRENAG